MSKQTKCWECWGLNGHHWPACQSRGYSAVGPHPSAPPREAPAPARDPSAPLEMCCGGTTVRAVCTFHGPSAATERAPAYEVGDETVDAVRREPTSCGQYMRTYRGGLLVDEEPIDCYVGAGGYAVSAPAFTVEALPATAEQRAAFCLPIRITLTGALSQICVRGTVSV
jgi:hypothetical protein